MRNYNEFSALWRALIFQKAFYIDVVENWRGIALRFLCLILLLTWVIAFTRVTVGFNGFLNNEAPALLKDFPPMALRAGHVSSPVSQPYIFRDERSNPLVILDTTNQTTASNLRGARMLITETQIIQDQHGTLQVHELRDFPDMTLDRTTMLQWLTTVRNLMIPVGTLVCFLFSLGYRLFAALCLALLGLAFASALNARISFGALMRLAVFSMTASILLETVGWLIQWGPGFLGWCFYCILSAVYLFMAVKFNADAQRDAQEYDPGAPNFPTPGN